jgi:hypothetical protein
VEGPYLSDMENHYSKPLLLFIQVIHYLELNNCKILNGTSIGLQIFVIQFGISMDIGEIEGIIKSYLMK